MKEGYKIVGVSIKAPVWAKHMAFDASGQSYFYEYDICSIDKAGMFCLAYLSGNRGEIESGLCLDVPSQCSNPDWWKGTKREIDARSGVVNIYVKAPVWARWMAFDSTGELCFYSSKPKAYYFYHKCEKCERWNYSAKGRTSDLRIKVPENTKNKDWWKGTLRSIA